VDLVGFEPTTSSMPWKRAPNCATGPFDRDITILAHPVSVVKQSCLPLAVQFTKEASQTRYPVAKNATIRSACPDPSPRKERSLQGHNRSADGNFTMTTKIGMLELI
jgi:hypothetical protein